MSSAYARTSAVFLAVRSLSVLGTTMLGCETGALLGEPCRLDDECVTGVCRGGKCRPPLALGTNPAVPQDAGADVEPDADPPEDAEPDVLDAAKDAMGDGAARDVGGDATDAGTG
ncbi:MAG: hypothetical protein MUF54_04455 [Polyangiaceae bacterium]|jgi:hypothetical protein|nr:hypothetical protein [Polyangiaceae bacterium]